MTGLMASRLHAYILPGRATDPRPGLAQAEQAEALGLGGVLLSERWETKELGAVMGALTQRTGQLSLVAGLTHFGTRHPLVIAGMSATLQALSAGRFVLGFGRGVPSGFRKLGIPVFNNAGMADCAGILRRLWAGETVCYEGPAGTYPEMQLAQGCANPPPMILGAVGPKTLALGGAHFDGVLLHPFLTCEGVARSAAIVRKAAEQAGRDPASVTIYATVVTAPDTMPEAHRHDVLEARAVSYFMHREVGLPIVSMNGWSEEPLDRLEATGLSRLEYGQASVAESRRLMAEAVSLLPHEWLAEGAAQGSLGQCIDRLQSYIDAGADRIVLHGIAIDQLPPLLAAAAASAPA